MSKELIERLREYAAGEGSVQGYMAELMCEAADALEAKSAPVGEREAFEAEYSAMISANTGNDVTASDSAKYRDGEGYAPDLPYMNKAWRWYKAGAAYQRAQQPQSAEAVVLSVWYGPMPESNGKQNYTALLHRKGESLFDGAVITLDRSEYPDRVRYEADRVRYLIGELAEEPCITDYDADAHSGYVAPPTTPQPSAGVVMPKRLRGALALVLKALDRDAADGREVRGEMATELRSALDEFARLNGKE